MIDFLKMRQLMRRVDQAKMNRSRAWARATGTTQILSDMPKGGGGDGKFERNMDEVLRAESVLVSLQAQLAEERDRLRKVLPLLPASSADALRMRYIDGYSVRRIAIELSYSESYTFRFMRLSEKRANSKRG